MSFAFGRDVGAVRVIQLSIVLVTLSLPSFAFAQTGIVTGTVTNAATATGIQGVLVSFCRREGASSTSCVSTTTNALGAYSRDLPPGTYHIQTSNTLGFTNEIFPDILCAGSCSSTIAVESGTPVQVVAGTVTSDRDFALDLGGTITGTVTDAGTSSPLQGVFIRALTRISGTIVQVGGTTTNASGAYTIRGLPAGRYFLNTSSDTHLNEIYDNLPCDGFCSQTTTVQTGVPIDVAQGVAIGSRDFGLVAGGAISGTITSSVGGTPIAGLAVEVYRQVNGNFVFFTSRSSNASGVYSVGGLPTGTYVAATANFGGSSGPGNFVDEIYDNIPCLGRCAFALITTGAQLSVTAGVANSDRHFVLDPGSSISGTVTDAAAAPLADVSVQIYSRLSDGSASFAGSATTAGDGTYTVTGLATGTYFAFTVTFSSGPRVLNEIFNDIPCSAGSCFSTNAVTVGTPIAVTAPAATPGINFSLLPRNQAPSAPGDFTVRSAGGTTLLTWTPPSTGGLATSYIVEGGVTPGGTIATLTTANTSIQIPGIPPGQFYLRVRGVNAFGTGPASSEFRLVIHVNGTAAVAAPINPLVWVSGGRLTVTFADAPSGGVPDGYVLEVGLTAGTANLASVPLSSRSFTFRGVPPGAYFVRVRARLGTQLSPPSRDVMLLVGGVPSPPDAPQSFSHSVNGATINLSWSLPFQGTPTSYIIEAGSVSGASDLVILNTGSPARTASFPGIPQGTYFLRIRAVNAVGAGPVSNERVVVVQ